MRGACDILATIVLTALVCGVALVFSLGVVTIWQSLV